MIDFKIIYFTFIIVILVSIQYTLNKILMILKEIKDKEKFYNNIDTKASKKVSKGDYFNE